jgi:hypothetical protein
MLLVAEIGENYDGDIWMLLLDAGRVLKGVKTRHLQVEQNYVWLELCQACPQLRAGGGLAHHFDVRCFLDGLQDPSAQRWMIVYNKNPYHSLPLCH